MAVSVLSAAREVCEARDWTVSNLELQKILYIAHMFFLGRTDGQPLIRENFEAWDYGPVVPELYHRVKVFGSDRVRNVFHWVENIPEGTPERDILKEASDALGGKPASRLVAVTHWKNGAWAKYYQPGIHGIIIPNAAILEEYRAREAA